MSSRRGRVSAAIVNNNMYVCGGSDGQKELNTGEYIDLTSMNKWSMIKELSTPVAHSGKLFLHFLKTRKKNLRSARGRSSNRKTGLFFAYIWGKLIIELLGY